MPAAREALALAAVLAALAACRAAGLDGPAVALAAAALVLAPGWFALRALALEGTAGVAGAVSLAAALGLAVWAPPLAVALALHLPLGAVLAGVCLLALALAAVAARRRPRLPRPRRDELAAAAAGLAAYGWVAWRVAPGLAQDGFVHAGLVLRIQDRGGLSLWGMTPYRDGPPHAGYAFPLLHAAWAGVARVAGVAPADAFVDLVPVCAGLALVAAYALAVAFTGWRTAGWIAAAAVGWDLLHLLGGLVGVLNQPPAFTFWVLVPAALVAQLHTPRARVGATAAAVAGGLAVVLVHPTYAVPLLAMETGVAAGWALAGGPWRAPAVTAALTGLCAAAAAAAIWLLAVRGGASVFVASNNQEYLMSGDRPLLMVPWAPVARRPEALVGLVAPALLLWRSRRFAPLAGAVVAPLVVLLLPGLDTVLIRSVGMGQFHRYWEVLPWPAALAAACVVVTSALGRAGRAAAVAAAAAGSAALAALSGFWHRPAAVLVVAGLAAAAVSAARVVRRRAAPRGRRVHVAALPACALAAAVLAGGVSQGAAGVVDEARAGPGRAAFTAGTTVVPPGVVAWFARHARRESVVAGVPGEVYQLLGRADVNVVALTDAHTRGVPLLHADARRAAVARLLDPQTPRRERLAILRHYHVAYVLVDRRRLARRTVRALVGDPAFAGVYAEPAGRFVILRVRTSAAARSSRESAQGASSA